MVARLAHRGGAPAVRSADNADKFPSQLRHRADPVIGAAFSPPAPGGGPGGGPGDGQLLLRSHGFLCLVDLTAPLPEHARIHPPTHLAARNDLARRARVVAQARRSAQHGRPGAAAQSGGGVLSPAALAAAVGPSAKRQRSNSVASAASAASAASETGPAGPSELVSVTPGRRLRSDSVTSATSIDNQDQGTGEDEDEGEDGGAENRNFALTLQYRPVIFADYLGPGEIVVVEEPWLKIMRRLPDPIVRQRFGT